MDRRDNTLAGCLFVGEYVDEGQLPEDFAHLRNLPTNAEVERARVVADYVDSLRKYAES